MTTRDRPPVPSNSPSTASPVRRVILPRSVICDTHQFFQPYRRAKVEAVCFWFGVTCQGLQVVTTVAAPQLRQSRGYYQVIPESLHRLAADMRRQGLTNLAQVHTHPSSGVDHSYYDDENAYSTREGALSFVWPHYGAGLDYELAGIGVHERRGGRWERLDHPQVAQRIQIIDGFADFRWEMATEEEPRGC
ncbi:MAG: hypothetical protein ACJ789_04520 [Thermomicrobiales bacterium]